MYRRVIVVVFRDVTAILSPFWSQSPVLEVSSVLLVGVFG